MKIFLNIIIPLIFLIKYTSSAISQNPKNINQTKTLPLAEADDDIFANEVVSGEILFRDAKKEWREKMLGFISQYILMIPLPPHGVQSFFENITQVPSLMRGGFILEDASSFNEKLSFYIIAPNGSVIYTADSLFTFFNINCTMPGLYIITFNNKYMKKEIMPTFLMNSGQNLFLGKKTLNETESKMDNITSFLKRYEQDIKLSKYSRNKNKIKLKRTNRYFFSFSIIETIVLICVSIWQYYYLKHLFEIKGSL